MSWKQRILHWLLSPVVLVTVSFAAAIAFDEWRSEVRRAEYEREQVARRAAEPPQAPEPPLFKSIRDRNAEAVRAALARGADPDAPAKEKGPTPLQFAFLVKEGGGPARRDVIEALIEGGADLQSRMREGRSVLHVAARGTDPALVEFLIARGADVNAKADNGSTPLFGAQNAEVVALLVARGAVLDPGVDPDGTRFVEAVRAGDETLIKLWLARGADPNRPGKFGHGPIAYAVSNGKPQVVELLLAAGARPDARLSDGSSLLHIAAGGNNIDVATALIRGGADVHAVRPSGWTPLHVASALCYEEFAEMLVAHGANPNTRDKHGKPPLPCYAFARKPGRSVPVQIASCR